MTIKSELSEEEFLFFASRVSRLTFLAENKQFVSVGLERLTAEYVKELGFAPNCRISDKIDLFVEIVKDKKAG